MGMRSGLGSGMWWESHGFRLGFMDLESILTGACGT